MPKITKNKNQKPVIDLSTEKKLDVGLRYSRVINQLYHPTGIYGQDSQKLVYSFDNINKTKFSPILLKEWFFLVEKDGYLIIDYKPTKKYGFNQLENEMWWLWKNKYQILYHGPIDCKTDGKLRASELFTFVKRHSSSFIKNPVTKNKKLDSEWLRFVCKKTKSTLIPGDDITKWSFGIVTNGKRSDWIKKIISSIRLLNIPNYEILICGTHEDKIDKDTVYIPFNLRDDQGWITMKKNLLVQRAKYQNVCIIHDRITFSKNWYKGFLKWGNCFEHLSCVTRYKGNNVVGDWPIMDVEHKLSNSNFLLISALDYRDWYKKTFVSGSMHIGKKRIFSKNPWPINLYWNEGEDYFFSKQLTKVGHIPRFNTHSTVHALAARFIKFPKIKFDPKSEEVQHDKILPKRKFIKLLAYFKLFGILEIIDYIARNLRSVIKI